MCILPQFKEKLNERMIKCDIPIQWTIIYIYHKKEQNIDTCYNIDEPWKHYAMYTQKITYSLIPFIWNV